MREDRLGFSFAEFSATEERIGDVRFRYLDMVDDARGCLVGSHFALNSGTAFRLAVLRIRASLLSLRPILGLSTTTGVRFR